MNEMVITTDTANAAPLTENQYVQELFSILQNSGRDSTGLSALLGHVSEMESFVKRAEDKISEMKSQLAQMKEIQNHPVKNALKNTIQTLEHKVAEIKERLGELKHMLAEGCKSAVQAFNLNSR
jgi:predicted RNase H-like nuclease (RuvC/YqgF family)